MEGAAFADRHRSVLGAAPAPGHFSSLLATSSSSAAASSSSIQQSPSLAKRCAVLHVQIFSCRGLPVVPGAAATLPYCVIEYDSCQTEKRARFPPCNWHEVLDFDVTNPRARLGVWVYQDLLDGSFRCLGQLKLTPFERACVGATEWLPLTPPSIGATAVGGRSEAAAETAAAAISTGAASPPPELRLQLTVLQPPRSGNISIDDFSILKVIGRGSMGKVMVVRAIDTQRLYAVKVMKKARLLTENSLESTAIEYRVLRDNMCPFLVSLKFHFETPHKLYFVLDYAAGGELFVHLQQRGGFDEDMCRFYTAILTMALDYLHQNHIIYRDLKPENILVSLNGYLKLADFGLCKQTSGPDDQTSTFCGTYEYMAPELVRRADYGQEVDWWTLGSLLYEMLTGRLPFYDDNMSDMFAKILHQSLNWEDVGDDTISAEARRLVESLLVRDPAERLGAGADGGAAVARHPFFASLPWDAVRNQNFVPNWKPKLDNELDVSHFADEFTSQLPMDTPSFSTQLDEGAGEATSSSAPAAATLHSN